MKIGKIPTVTEYFTEFYKIRSFEQDGEYPTEEDIKQMQNDPDFEASMKCLHEYAVLFAKYHRKKQIEAIKEKVAYEVSDIDQLDIERMDSIRICIENAYREDNIQ